MFLFLISPTNQSLKTEAPAPVVLKLNAPDGELKSSEEVRLSVSVSNVSDHEVVILRTPGIIPEEQLRYQINIRDSDGKEPPQTAYFKEFNSPSAIIRMSNLIRHLKPGESVSDAIVLSKLFELKVPGRYRVHVSRGIPDEGGAIVKSNEITITIVN